jgi:hypothetical protein
MEFRIFKSAFTTCYNLRLSVNVFLLSHLMPCVFIFSVDTVSEVWYQLELSFHAPYTCSRISGRPFVFKVSVRRSSRSIM